MLVPEIRVEIAELKRLAMIPEVREAVDAVEAWEKIGEHIEEISRWN
jgi:hypothetical protein